MAWEITTGSDSVIIAFIDTGMDWEHPEFTNNLWVNPLEDKNGDGVFQPQSDLGEIIVDGYPGGRTVDDDNDGRSDYHDYQIKWADYNCNGVYLCGWDGLLFNANDDSTDKILAADDDDENGLRDDIIGWDWTACKTGYWDPKPYSQGGGSAHGNIVASIAAAEGDNNPNGELDKAMAGVVWKCRIMTLKVSEIKDTIDPTFVGYAIDYARVHGAHIINLSLGSLTDQSSIRIPIQNAISAGCFIVASADNFNQDTSAVYPAAYPGVCGVMATNRQDKKADFSNYNPSNEQWYDISAPGDSITALLPLDDVLFPDTMSYYYSVVRGTSGAAAFVSGTAALMKSVYSNWTNTDILWQLRNMSDNIDPFQSSGYVGRLGTGRLNATRALGYGGRWKEVWIETNHAWEQKAFVADTMVVDTNVVLTLRDSLYVYCADGRGGIQLVEGAQLIIPDNANVTFDDSFYVEVGKNCIFKIGKNAKVSFGDSCVIFAKDSGTVLIDSMATVQIGKKGSIITASEGWLKVKERAKVKCGDSTVITSNGYIDARSIADHNILFTHRLVNEQWLGIRFPSRTSAPSYMSKFEYVTIEIALTGIETYIDSMSITHSIIRNNDVGLKTISCSPIFNNNYFNINANAQIDASGQDRNVENNKVASGLAYGIIATNTSNVWIGNKADSNNIGLQMYDNTTSQFHSVDLTDSLTGNTFRYNYERGIIAEESTPSFVGEGGIEALNSCHDNNNPTADIDALDNSVIEGFGNYGLNGVTLYNDGSSTLIWDGQKMWDPIPNSAPKLPSISTIDTLKLATSERLKGNYTSSVTILKNVIDKNHSGQFAHRALMLLFHVFNDAEFVKKNNDPISKDIKTARANFETYLSGLKTNSSSNNLKKAAAEILADHKMVTKKFSSADSLYELLGSANPNSDIEKRCLYGQVIARKTMNNLTGAKTKTEALRTKYPNNRIGVVAKIFIDEPLTDAEKAMIRKKQGNQVPTSVIEFNKDNFALLQNYPNPFNPITHITFNVPVLSVVEIIIFDALGRNIKTYTNQEYSEGVHSVLFDASKYSSGIYFYQMNARSFAEGMSEGLFEDTQKQNTSFVSMKKMAVVK